MSKVLIFSPHLLGNFFELFSNVMFLFDTEGIFPELILQYKVGHLKIILLQLFHEYFLTVVIAFTVLSFSLDFIPHTISEAFANL